MTEIIMDGRFKGHTKDEYEAMREVDCEIAETMGWYPLDSHRILWLTACDGEQGDGNLRDEPDGIPFFSADMNGAEMVLLHVVRRWRTAARNVFYTKLQERASFDKAGVVAYPDCLTSLISSGLPGHACQAYLDTVRWAQKIDFNLYPVDTIPEIKTEVEETVDEEGNKIRKGKITAMPGKPPWVH